LKQFFKRCVMRAAALVFVALGAFGCTAAEPLQGASGPVPITRALWVENQNERHVSQVTVPAEVSALMAAPDRLAADRALDAWRQSAELLAFLDVKAGMRVAELGAGGGHMTELLARAVGPSGQVYAVNPPDLVASRGLSEAWRARLARPVNRNVTRVDQGFDEPLPARDLDLVYIAYPYRDLPKERAVVDAAVFAALRRGGKYVVYDHAPNVNAARVEEARNARYEIERGGFVLVSEGHFFRSPLDAEGTPHVEREARFVIAFMKP
jgi:predicted methyltransferase